MARKSVIKAFVTVEEAEKAKQVAAAEGLTVSAYLRRCVLFAQPPKPTKQAA